MGVIRINQTFATRVSPSRLFKALILDSHNLCPKLMFASIRNIEFLEGDGDVGSIKQINFTEASPYRYVKHRIDELDKENFTCKYTLIEGDALAEKLESITYEVKFEANAWGGCICKMSSEYRTIGDVEVKEEEIEDGKDRAIGMYEVVEAYLLAHPNAYK
ncbi:PREDICTED: major allergen Pru ar 1-like [Nelumbo nucifera]|uniref:Bet v I/Major latex protein domain-containing protein n=2 Tax=Nelumbo nucifera TaxID=4432 RepID=A0A822YVD2_NELNU|nr:PREDICTED: major allergen Pru ar 1-like [Nelumbo nucifera]DAD33208.1 TPA_asm: hypothetical protein HUJ06_012059 [Nelumbo nucifera]